MHVGIVRKSLIAILLLGAKTLALLESKLVDLLVKLVIVGIFGYTLFLHKVEILGTLQQTQTDVNTYIWYKTLPTFYFTKLEERSQAVFAKYQEAIKPKPPTRISDIPFPAISAKSHIILDVPTNTVLSSKDADLPLPPASTAKLATALASLKIYKLDEEITVPQFCTQVDGTKAEFLQGQKFLVGDLLKALLVYSSGDAGCVLSIGKVSYANFIGFMNDIAKDANLQHTKLTNPIGLDDADGQNLASAEDLAKLGLYATKNDFIKEVVRLKEFELKDLDGKYSKRLSNTNKLLTDVPESVGIKTGTTTGAGEVLIYEYAKDKIDLVIVVMGSTDRFADVKQALDWVLTSYQWEK